MPRADQAGKELEAVLVEASDAEAELGMAQLNKDGVRTWALQEAVRSSRVAPEERQLVPAQPTATEEACSSSPARAPHLAMYSLPMSAAMLVLELCLRPRSSMSAAISTPAAA